MVTLGTVAARISSRLRSATAAAVAPDAAPAAASRAVDLRRIILQASAIWLATRVGFVALNYLGELFGRAPAHPDLVSWLAPYAQAHEAFAKWLRFDAGWYVIIGAKGYAFQTFSTAGFFPLYPLLIHLLTLVLGTNQELLAALLIANLATLVAFIGLGLLAAHEEHSEGAGPWLIMVVAAYPFAYFLFAPYTEGLFLAAVVFALYCARQGFWWRAAACAFVAGMSRPTGAALVLPLIWEFGRQRGFWEALLRRAGGWRERLTPRVAAMGLALVAAVPLAVGAFLLYLKLSFGSASLYVRSQSILHGHVNWPVWRTLFVLLGRMTHPSLGPGMGYYLLLLYTDGCLLLGFLVLTAFCVRRLPLMYTLYMLGTLYLLLSEPIPRDIEVVPGAGRYLLLAIPVFLLISRWMERRPWLGRLVLGVGFVLQAALALFWIGGGFIE